MIKKITILIALTISVSSLYSQSISEIKADHKNYIYGEGKASTISRADNMALQDIISKISISIKSSIKQGAKEGSDASIEENFESIISTHSNATLNNTQQVIIENEPDAHVFRYIKRTDVDRIFDARKEKITTMIGEAQRALTKGQINDALRYYSWSHAMLQSLRYPNEMTVLDDKGKEQMANVYIPQCINNVLSDLRISVTKVEEDMVTLQILHDGDRVNSIDYTIFDGRGWSNIYSGQDGVGIIELRNNVDMEKLQLKVEVLFENETVMDPEIRDLLALITAPVYRKAYISVDLKNIAPVAPPKTVEVESQRMQQAQTESQAKSNASKRGSTMVVDSHVSNMLNSVSGESGYSYPALSQVEDVESYVSIVKKVAEGILTQDKASIESLFSESGLKAYSDLIEYGSARIVDSSSPRFYSLGEKVYCRDILMSFSFKTNKRTFIESVVFEFDEDSKISNITFGLTRQAAEGIFARDDWPEAARIILTHFLEGYKSAYSLKQIEYIESVFAEDALIITGSYVREPTQAEMTTINKKYVKYTQHSKSEYVRRMRSIFNTNEFINVNFADSQLIKAGRGGEIYGIEIKQEYHSTNYGDTGYLFLMVDLNDIEKPIIHVRTWQPEKDPNFGTYSLANF